MTSYWSQGWGCQAGDYYELLKSFLEARREIYGVEAAQFINCSLEELQPLLARLVEEGVAVADGPESARRYRLRD